MNSACKFSNRHTFVDLFCGAGGMSHGFSLAGFKAIGAIDNWSAACASYQLNEPDAVVKCGDITEIDAEEFLKEMGSRPDLVLGGPSCQGFSTSSGLSRDGRKFDDPRNSLFEHYVRFVSVLQPNWIVMENVPGLLLFKKGEVARAICHEFERIGYHVVPMILLAADYGVPQLRRRLFFIGNKTGEGIPFPAPSHGDPDLWKDYALPFAHLSRIGNKNHSKDQKPHVSLEDALSDLPPIGAGESFEDQAYPSLPLSDYQQKIRFNSQDLRLHVASKLSDSSLACIKLLKPGENWTDLPDHIIRKRFSKIRSYDATTMLKRPYWHKPSHTVTTKFNDATAGAFIHPIEDRTFSVREGARIQSFPDCFKFSGSFSQIRKQIGNAVPPLLAASIANALAPEVMGVKETSPRLLIPSGCDVDNLLGIDKKINRDQLSLI